MSSSSAQKSAIRNPQSAIPEGFIPATLAASIKGVHVRTIRRRCAAGEMAAVRVDGFWYVDPAADPALRLATGETAPAPAAAGDDLAGLSQAQRERAFARMTMARRYLAALEHKPAGMTSREFSLQFAAQWSAENPANKTGRSALLGWVAAWKAKGIAGLVDRRGGARTPAPFTAEAKSFLLGLYADQHQLTIPYIYTVLLGEAEQQGWNVPALRTVQRWIRKHVDPKLVAAGRDPKMFRDRMTPDIRRDWTLVEAMTAWVADHRQADVWIPRQDDRTLEWSWARPWLTMFLDCRSWFPVGYAIEFDSPDANRVMGVFGSAIEAWGAPVNVILDNGKDFRARDVAGGRPKRKKAEPKLFDEKRHTNLMEGCGIHPVWAMPYNARAKIIERFFAIMADAFDRTWPTYCGNSPDRRPEQLKGLKAGQVDTGLLNIDTFRAAFGRWLLDDFSLAPSPAVAARKLSPRRAFMELRPKNFVPARPSAETLSLLLTRSRRAVVGKDGVYVRAFMNHYWSDALEDRRCASGRDIGRHVVYRYRPGDPSKIWVFDFRSDRFLCVAEPYAGAGLHPLAASDDDRDKLAGAIALQRRTARAANATVKAVRAASRNVLVEAHRRGQESRGILDDPASIKKAPPPVIKLMPGGQMDAAAQAGVEHDRRKEQTRAAAKDLAALLSTGTDAADARPAGPSQGEEFSPWEALAAAEDGDGQQGES